MVTALDKAESERNSAKVTIEWLETKLASHSSTPLTEATVDMYLTMTSEAHAKVKDTYEKIVACAPTDMMPHNSEYFNLIDKVPVLQSGFQVIKASFASPQVHTTASASKPSFAEIRLPRMDLPKFDGEIQSWMSFHDMFSAAVHKNSNLTKAQKLTYLKSSLTGEASRQVSSLPVTDDNYDTAWGQLSARYDNKRELLFAVLRRFVELPTLHGNSASDLRSHIDVSKECFNSLATLGLPVEHWDAILLFHMATKLDSLSREMWEQTLTDSSIPPLKGFLDFLEQRARALAAGGTSQVKPHQGGKSSNTNVHIKRVAHAHHVSQPSGCPCCSDNHILSKCSTFLAMKVPQRFETVKKSSLCFNCLREGHSIAKCSSRGTCRTCNAKHHTLLHRDKAQPSPNSDTSTLQLGHHSSHFGTPQGMLATAIVKIRDSHGRQHLCRAFLDGGSTTSFITESCVRRLNLPRAPNTAQIRGLASTSVGTAKGTTTLNISSHFSGNSSYTIDALILPKVTARLPVHPCDPSAWPHLRGLQLADPSFHQPDNIDILLGADIFYNCLLNESQPGPSGCPMAIKTTLGWIIAGQLSNKSTEIIVNYSDVDMERQLHKLWEIETVSSPRSLTNEELNCENHFAATHRITKEGRFVVKLPIRTSSSTLGSSRNIAIRQLKQLEGRLSRAPERYTQYRDFMNEYLSLGHMQEIKGSEVLEYKSPNCYIPHHFVCKESSSTTKLRVVFNASSKTSNGISLNDILMVGPVLQDNLSDILMRFRAHPIAFTADVAKMYRQILVDNPDNDLQRIVWRNSSHDAIRDFRLVTVTYGTGPSSFLATRALQQLAHNHTASLPLACRSVLKDMYVDDLMSGSETIDQALEVSHQLLKLMKEGGMELRKWSSNSQSLLNSIPAELRNTQPTLSLDMDMDQTIKTLGVYWDPVPDVCSFRVTLDASMHGHQLTKRNVLSEISKIFDPLGWLSPVIIKARIMIQDLWKLQLSWDEELPQSFQREWVQYRDLLHTIEQITIPRCISPGGSKGRKYLTGYCDASEKAYAAVVYLCVYRDSNPATISLVTSKVRVAPSRPVSLPRLELCGALLLSQLISNVRTNLCIDESRVTAWTDSTVVLAWISSHPSRWKTFVANRVTEIQDRVPSTKWGHVKGSDNPADCASRGLGPDELKLHPLWWTGPAWIQSENYVHQLTSQVDIDDPVASSEEKSVVKCSHIIIEDTFLRRYSSLSRLKLVTALLLRFNNNCIIKSQERKHLFPTQPIFKGPITPHELDVSLMRLVRIVQTQEFSHEICALESGLEISAKSSLRSLAPFLDNKNMLRVGGRLRNASLPNDQKQPLLLPRHNHLTKLIIMSEHLKNLHAGPQLLQSLINARFWIIRGRDAIRHQLKRCTVCIRNTGRTLQQYMGDFPASRVTPTRPFVKCGVDYAGPFIIKPISPRSKISIKAYMAIFVCFSTRAIHLEVVSSLSTAAFIATMHRFISRRGKPTDVYSDCGTNFVGADHEIQEAVKLLNSSQHNKSISEKLASDGIHWHFNPPSAPHFGGLWEAGVKSVKYHLKRVIGLARLTYEELSTVIIQVEACLNSRPLTPISTDPNDLSALTPGHFLIGAPLTALPEVDITLEKTGRLTRWQNLQKLHQHFWHRWSNEFIARMQQRPKWLSKRHDIRVGDLVIIKDDRLPPLKWQLGRVVQMHPGADGLVRVVSLKTSTGELKRPIVKLCLLPIESTQSENINPTSDS